MEIPVKKIVAATVGLLLLIIFLMSWAIVPAGNRGVRLRFGAVCTTPIPEGLCFKLPFIDEIIQMEVRTQKNEIKDEAASHDLQIVDVVIATNFNIEPASACLIYQTYGPDYIERIIEPNIKESIKATTSQYTAEELIIRRELVRIGIKNLLISKMPVGIKIEELNIVNFNFSPAFNHAIEQKVSAEQNALAAKNKLVQIEFEAQQRVAESKGKAEAINIESLALKNSPEIITLRTLEKWDGKLPQVMSGAVPFIDINLGERKVK